MSDIEEIAPLVLLAGIMYYLMLCAPAGSDRCE